MKLLWLIPIALFLSSTIQADIALQARKWELYKKLNLIMDELDNHEHNRRQINRADRYLQRAYVALQKREVEFQLLSPTKNKSIDSTPTFQLTNLDNHIGLTARLYNGKNCANLVSEVDITSDTAELQAAELSSDGVYIFTASVPSPDGEIDCVNTEIEYTLDQTPPPPVSSIYIEGEHDDLTTSPIIYIENRNRDRSDIHQYRIGISNQRIGGDNIAEFRNIPGTAEQYQFNNLALDSGNFYYVTIMSVDEVGNVSNWTTAPFIVY